MDALPSRSESDATVYRQTLEGLRLLAEEVLRVINAAVKQLAHEGGMMPSTPCTACPRGDECTEPCDRVKTILPAAGRGRGHRENLTGLHPGTLQGIEKVRRADVFAQFEEWRADLPARQWEAVILYYRDGMTEEEIASRLGVSRSAVNGRLVRARNKKAELEKARRQEMFETWRKQREEDVE